MAKSYQSFRKRERESKLRERAQLKRERRQQTQQEKKKRDVETPIVTGDIQENQVEVGE